MFGPPRPSELDDMMLVMGPGELEALEDTLELLSDPRGGA